MCSSDLNQVFKNKMINDISRSDLQYLRESLKRKRQIVDRALDEIDNLLKNSGDEKLLVNGTLNILNEPEFKDLDKLRRILQLLEASDAFKDIIPANIGEEVDIVIGHENKIKDIKDLSLVYTGYKTSGDSGAIGLIGPVRMEYWKAAGTVEAVRSAIEKTLKSKN